MLYLTLRSSIQSVIWPELSWVSFYRVLGFANQEYPNKQRISSYSSELSLTLFARPGWCCSAQGALFRGEWFAIIWGVDRLPAPLSRFSLKESRGCCPLVLPATTGHCARILRRIGSALHLSTWWTRTCLQTQNKLIVHQASHSRPIG